MTAVIHLDLRRTPSGARRRLLALLAAGSVLAAAAPATAQESWPIDRWLVAVPAEVPDSFRADLLEAPGEAGVLPDRGRVAGGLEWELVREDGAADFSLDSLREEPGSEIVAYAHAYVRLAADRTLRLRWNGSACARSAAWINGRPVPGPEPTGGEIAARFGAGWNTLLLKLQAGDCPFGFGATLEAEATDAEDVTPRVQASRPYGDVRTGPEDWVVTADTARIAERRSWRADRLYAGLAVELTAWGRAAVSGVELELRDGAEGRARTAWLVPAEPATIVVPVRIDRVDRLLSTGLVGLRLTWDEEEVDHRLVVVGDAPTASSPVMLDGWEIVRSTGDAVEPRGAGRLPNDAGWRLEGEWEVPEALAGRPLRLNVSGAPADYELNGRPAKVTGDEVTLCSPCSRGVDLRLTAVSTDAWTSHPLVRMAP